MLEITCGEGNLTLNIALVFGSINGKVLRLLTMLPDVFHNHVSVLPCKTPQGGQSSGLSSKSHSFWNKRDGLRERLATHFTAGNLGQTRQSLRGVSKGERINTGLARLRSIFISYEWLRGRCHNAIEFTQRKPLSSHTGEWIVRPQLDMKLGAIAAIILDFAAVAFVVGVLVLDRWLGMRSGMTLDTVLIVVIVLAAAAWLAGTRFRRRLARDLSARTDANPLYTPVTRERKRSRDA
jgi:hypothetical protein